VKDKPETNVLSDSGHQHMSETGHEHHAEAHAHSAAPEAQEHSHHHHDPKKFRNLFWISLVFTLPTVYFSLTVQQLLGFQAPVFTFSEYLPALLGTMLFFIGGRVFFQGARAEMKRLRPGMMSLVSLALIVAFGYSLFVFIIRLFGVDWMGMDFWWELASLISIMLLGHWIETRAVASASDALKELAKLIPDTAERVIGTKTEIVSLSMLEVGDVVLVRPGATVPADGEIIRGRSSLDESMLTGESAPKSKKLGDSVFAGSINGSSSELSRGALTVQITGVGDTTVLAGVMRLVAEAQKSKSKTQLLADRAAGWLFYLAIASAIGTLIYWLVVGTQSPDYILEKVVTVLVVACPHALGLAIPLVSAITASKAAKQGILIRDRGQFELARKLGIILFDKTGTLTTGKRNVVSMHLARGSRLKKKEDVLALAASLEKKSEHSLSFAIMKKAKSLDLRLNRVAELEFMPGIGIRGTVGVKNVMVGSAALLTQNQVSIDISDLEVVDAANNAGHSVVYVVVDNQLEGFIFVGDEIRENSKAAILRLLNNKKPVAIISGDALGVVSQLSRELGVREYYGELLPQDKIVIVRKLQQEGLRVGFVGDGVNDAPALAQADVGIAIGTGTDVAIESAGIILVSSDPEAVSEVIELSRRSHGKMVQNLWWAAGYNLLAIPVASGILQPYGLDLSPAAGAVLMSLSTVIVAANAQLLRRR
jgi:Cu2+-exporting ATPase